MLEKLENKLAQIKERKQSVIADYQALCGAEQVLIQLIEECKADTKTE